VKKSIVLLLIVFSIIQINAQSTSNVGRLVKYDKELEKVISNKFKINIIAEGLDWSEGPLMIDDTLLIFSDVPKNTIYKWTPNKGKEIYLTPSGYTGEKLRGGETGSNGLILSPDKKLVLCQHGDRRIAYMDGSLYNPEPDFKTITADYNGKKFDSPNDGCFDSKGDFFFTDPPYGLEKYVNDPLKENKFQGVYKVDKMGKTTLLVDSITRPNGIAFLPGGKQVIIANSDPDKPYWYTYDYDGVSFVNGRIFFDAKSKGKKLKGLPDGLKIDKKGYVFATGPGGVSIFNKDGTRLGLIELDNASSNCALSPNQKTLYVTNDMYVLKIKLR
jgi:gluconolactonase